MTHVVLTGAGGFIGRRLAARLLHDGRIGDRPITRLTATDLHLPALPADGRLHPVPGSLGDHAVRAALCEGGVDTLFHLAALPGGAAETDPALGLDVNVTAAMALFGQLARQAVPARVVYTSTIAVFGVPLPGRVDDDTLPLPTMSYGAQKLMMETLLADMARRGTLDARCVRLPGIVARPRSAGGHVSAFMSDMFHDIPTGTPITLPVSAAGTVWAMSVPRVVDNLLHAAGLAAAGLPPRRAWTLPALRTSIGALVDAIASQSGQPASLAHYAPVAAVQAQFASNPPLEARLATGLGFQAESSVEALVRTVLADLAQTGT